MLIKVSMPCVLPRPCLMWSVEVVILLHPWQYSYVRQWMITIPLWHRAGGYDCAILPVRLTEINLIHDGYATNDKSACHGHELFLLASQWASFVLFSPWFGLSLPSLIVNLSVYSLRWGLNAELVGSTLEISWLKHLLHFKHCSQQPTQALALVRLHLRVPDLLPL